MIDKIFVDTNILVYPYDNSEPEKQAKSIAVLDRLIASNSGVISSQILAEFFVTVTRKIATPLTISEAIARIENYLNIWIVVEVTPLIVLEAAKAVKNYQLSFWDAQILATAKLYEIPLIYSEDFNQGACLDGVKFVNPLS